MECGAYQRHACLVRYIAPYGHGAEIRTEQILLLTVEIHPERLYVVLRAKCCLTVCRIEIILRLRYVAYQLYLPSFVWREGQICLIIYETWIILSRSVKGFE